MTQHSASGRPAPVARQQQVAPGDLTRIVLRPIASSAPLGFYAFGVGSILYTAQELSWIPLSQTTALAVLVLAFVAPLQVLAGLIAYLARDGGLATATLIFGAAWVAIGIALLNAPPGSRSPVLGVFMLSVAVLTAATGAGSLRTRPLLSVLSALAVGRYALAGCYELTGNGVVQLVAGWLGIPVVAISLYGGTAFLLEDGMRRTVLPLGRRNSALVALEGGLGDQVDRIAQEAGVRHSL